jgi:hypothetical protein
MTITTLTPDPEWVDRYLRELRVHGLERTAADVAGTTIRQVNKLREESTEFDLACKDAEEMSSDTLELEARRRAVDGVEKGVYYKGERVDTQIEYSDTLLTTLLKGRRENVFGDKRKISFNEPLAITIRSFDAPAYQPAATRDVTPTTSALTPTASPNTLPPAADANDTQPAQDANGIEHSGLFRRTPQAVPEPIDVAFRNVTASLADDLV